MKWFNEPDGELKDRVGDHTKRPFVTDVQCTCSYNNFTLGRYDHLRRFQLIQFYGGLRSLLSTSQKIKNPKFISLPCCTIHSNERNFFYQVSRTFQLLDFNCLTKSYNSKKGVSTVLDDMTCFTTKQFVNRSYTQSRSR